MIRVLETGESLRSRNRCVRPGRTRARPGRTREVEAGGAEGGVDALEQKMNSSDYMRPYWKNG